MRRKIFPILIILVLTSLFSACEQPFARTAQPGQLVNISFDIQLGIEGDDSDGRWNMASSPYTSTLAAADRDCIMNFTPIAPSTPLAVPFSLSISSGTTIPASPIYTGTWQIEVIVYNNMTWDIIGYRVFQETYTADMVLPPHPVTCYGTFGQFPNTSGSGDISLTVDQASLGWATPADEVLARLAPSDGVGSPIVLNDADWNKTAGQSLYTGTALNNIPSGNYRLSVYLRKGGASAALPLASTVRVYDSATCDYTFAAQPTDVPPSLNSLSAVGIDLDYRGLVCTWDNTENFFETGYEVTVRDITLGGPDPVFLINDPTQNSFVFPGPSLGHEYQIDVIPVNPDYTPPGPTTSVLQAIDEVWVHSTLGDDFDPATPYQTLDGAYLALDAALFTYGHTSGTIHIAGGFYTSSGIDTPAGRNYIFEGSYASDWISGQSINTYPTVIQSTSDFVLDIEDGSLNNLHLIGGSSGADSAAVIVSGTGSVNITNCILDGGAGSNSSTGLNILSGGPSVLDSTITGGSSAGTSTGVSISSTTLFFPFFSDCDIMGGTGAGGSTGVFVDGGNCTFSDTDPSDGKHSISSGNVAGPSAAVKFGTGIASLFNLNISGGNSTSDNSYGVFLTSTSTTNGPIDNCDITSGNGQSTYAVMLEDGGRSGSFTGGTYSSGAAQGAGGISAGFHITDLSDNWNGSITEIVSVSAGPAVLLSYGIYINSPTLSGTICGDTGAFPPVSTISSGNITGASGTTCGIYISSSNNAINIRHFFSISSGNTPNGLSSGLTMTGNLSGANISEIGAMPTAGTPFDVSGGIRAGSGSNCFGLNLGHSGTGTLTLLNSYIVGGTGSSTIGLRVFSLSGLFLVEKSIIHGSSLGADGAGVLNSRGVEIMSATGGNSEFRLFRSFVNGGRGTSLGLITEVGASFGAGLKIVHSSIMGSSHAAYIDGGGSPAMSVIRDNLFQNNHALNETFVVDTAVVDSGNIDHNNFYNGYNGGFVLNVDGVQSTKLFNLYTPGPYLEQFNYHFPMALHSYTGFPMGAYPRIFAMGGVASGIAQDFFNTAYGANLSFGPYRLSDSGTILYVNSNSGGSVFGNQGGETDFYSYLTVAEALQLVNVPDAYIDYYTEIAFGGSMTINLDHTLKLGRPVDINANGYNVILNGQNSRRILEIYDGDSYNIPADRDDFSSVTLMGLEFFQGRDLVDNLGGAVRVAESGVTFDTCTFRNNAAGLLGGAVFYSGGLAPPAATENIRFNSCSFIGNTILNSTLSGHGGGAVFLRNVNSYSFNFCVFDSNFVGGVGAGNGGALYLDSHTGDASTRINNCTFLGNYSHGGGAVYFRENSIHRSSITESVFSGNYTYDSSTHYGGAVQVGVNTAVGDIAVDIVNSVFAGNSTTAGYGSAVYVGSTSNTVGVTMRYCTVSGNATKQIAVRGVSTLDIQDSIIVGTGPVIGDDYPIHEATPNNVSATNVFCDVPLARWQPADNDLVSVIPGFAVPFININDPDGADNIWRTNDDGLIILAPATGVNTGTSALTYDIIGTGTRFDGFPDPGAYEYR